MNADKINRWLTLGANIAVVIGIILVALQINQNNRMMRTQTRNAITTSIMDFTLSSETSAAEELVLKADGDLSRLTPSETRKARLVYTALIRLWENIHYQYRNGVFDEAEFAAARNTWRLANPLLRDQYCRQKQAHSLSPAFVDEMDRLAPGSCDAKVDVGATQNAPQPVSEKDDRP
jgi:hypothetical protein